MDIGLVVLAIVVAFLIALRFNRTAESVYVRKLLSEEEEDRLKLDIADVWVHVLSLSESSASIHYRFFRRDQLLHEETVEINFAKSSEVETIFPGDSYPFKSPFKLTAFVRQDRKRLLCLVITLSLKEGKPLPFGGKGYGW